MLSIETGGSCPERDNLCSGAAEHWSARGEELSITVVLLGFEIFFSFPSLSLFEISIFITISSNDSSSILYFISIIKAFLSQPISFMVCSLHPTRGQGCVSEWLRGT